jgi:glycosyltransferase involved in cell wall biosynthesis
MEIVRSFSSRLPGFQVVDATWRRGLNHARNAGAAAARGDLLAFCDADDVVTPGWLGALVSAAGEADLVAGSFDNEALNGQDAQRWSPPDAPAELPVGYNFRPYAPGGNCAVRTVVAREVGWDEAFPFGSSDVEFSWRVQRAGYRLAIARDAVIRRRLAPTPGALARGYFAYGLSAPLLYQRAREHGMPRSDTREALGAWAWLARWAPRAARSCAFRGTWCRIAGMRSGRLVGSARRRVLFL